ncbi:MAG: endonuclease/exonuclease/phosphatase family protein [Fidelibacterota bacterium]|nr:MAG: endonuclease/exonuclease/phosphatase family protein [Candidatus Neomarinimicrobiota bacterium]
MILGLVALFAGCPGPEPSSEEDVPRFGTSGTFEVVTWNIENFGQDALTPFERVAAIIRRLDVDMVAVQEIVSQEAFDSLLASLPGWGGYRASPSSSWQELAYLYRTSTIAPYRVPFEIYLDEDQALPREPFVFPVAFGSVELFLINNHFKCCGNGIIEADPSDEEARRQAASQLLEDYIRSELPGRNVILLGDLNDEVNEPRESNVFQNFIDDDSLFNFVTTTIAADTSQATYPHPPWFSFIDHIMITASLFDEWQSSGHVETLRLDDVLDDYFDEISDHRPVAMKLELAPSLP